MLRELQAYYTTTTEDNFHAAPTALRTSEASRLARWIAIAPADHLVPATPKRTDQPSIQITRAERIYTVPVPMTWASGYFWAGGGGGGGGEGADRKEVAVLEEEPAGAGSENFRTTIATRVISSPSSASGGGDGGDGNPLARPSSGFFWARREAPRETRADRAERNERRAWLVAQAIVARGALCEHQGDGVVPAKGTLILFDGWADHNVDTKKDVATRGGASTNK